MRFLGALGLAVLVLAGIALVGGELVSKRMQDRLLREVLAESGVVRERACQLEPCAERSFGEAIDRWLADLPKLPNFPKVLALEPCPDGVCAEPMGRALLAATHGAWRRAPAGLGLFAPDPRWQPILRVARSGVALAPDLPPSEGLSRCRDTLALGRDVALSAGLLSDMVGIAIAEAVLTACVPIFARAPAEEGVALRVAVAKIRAGFPPFAEVLRRELVELRLRALGPFLDEDRRARLPAGAAALIEGPPAGRLQRLVGIYLMRDLWQQHEALLAAYMGPASERAQRLAAVPSSALSVLPDFHKLATRHEALLARLEVESPGGCSLDSDCVAIPADCCGCGGGGGRDQAVPVRDEARLRAEQQAKCQSTACLAAMSGDFSCTLRAACGDHRCGLR